ncbi:hypothetical protein J3R30DRAFT_3466546 [Lentinula aciculospora]|uniref:GST N-terminal domain-containing protein n=1 Tax=Lentinula aciculospora TaxID=153920 RepID=A0A9W9AEZ6_9AGAR|nr:hypothetical protein J3R30DRAFT_3466546 [Lentinula aciculospora]
MAESTIVLYDIPFAEPNICWSPNTWKTRCVLNYEGLAYRTEWIEYPDIEALCIKIGAAPTGVKDDGTTPEYTLPVIHDPFTGQTISDSFDIAIYLHNTYPDTPRLFPPGTRALQSAFVQYVNFRVQTRLGQFLRPAVFHKLPLGKSQEYFRRTREALYNVKIEEWAPTGEDRVQKWKGVEMDLVLLDKHYKLAKEEVGGDFIYGVDPTFGDFALASIFQWCKQGFGVESKEWMNILTWQNGRWRKFIESLDRYTLIV